MTKERRDGGGAPTTRRMGHGRRRATRRWADRVANYDGMSGGKRRHPTRRHGERRKLNGDIPIDRRNPT